MRKKRIIKINRYFIMSDKVIRIGSQQGFAESWVNANAPSSLNLVDFEIPAGMVVDLTKSYVAFNTELTPSAQAFASAGSGVGNKGQFATDSPINSMLRLNNLGADGEAYEAPNAALIKNARISCDKGHIESIRRVDTLKAALFNMEHDREERKDDMNAFTAPKGTLGIGNQSSLFLDCVVRNTDGAGNKITGETSRQLARDVKVPLKSVFGIAEGAEAWDTSKFGTTRIHMETNWKHVKADELGGAEATSNSFDATNTWGAMEDVNAVAAAANIPSLITKFAYTDYQQTSPFYCGQRVMVSGTWSGGAVRVDIPQVIESIEMDMANSKLTITFDPTINGGATGLANPNGAGPENFANITMKADHTYTENITVNRAELVLFTRPPMDSPSEYQYITYTTEEDNGNAITSFARGYTMEGEAEQMMVCLAPANHILPSTVYESYRYAVDNKDMTGNRSVQVGSPLQYDRLTRALDNQYTDWRSAQLKFFNQTPNAPTQANAYDKANSTIVETLPLSDRPKYVDIQVEAAAGVADLRIYKQMVRSIKA
jgi:hypothetical protein